MPTEHEYKSLSESDKKKEDWMNAKWRPMMGWMYMAVCLFDFIIAPCMWSVIQALFHGGINVQWQPLTLQGAGLFHIAMGAVIGISAYGRTQEKLSGANNGGLQQPVGTTYQPPGGMGMNNNMGGMSSGQMGGFNNGGINNSSMGGGSTYGAPAAGGFGSPTPAFGSAPAPAFGTPAPAFGTPAPTCPNTGKPLGPAQSFPAL